MSKDRNPASTKQPLIVPKAFAAYSIVTLLFVSAILIATAPLFLGGNYSPFTHSISEAAAQGLHNAWIARLGFLCFGFAVIWLALLYRATWSLAVYSLHLAFGILMVCTAVFSHKPWLADAPIDHFEDFLHSMTANAIGFAFIVGVLSRLVQRPNNQWRRKILDIIAVSVALGVSAVWFVWPDKIGLIQRLMFAVAYLWYSLEALRLAATARANHNRASP